LGAFLNKEKNRGPLLFIEPKKVAQTLNTNDDVAKLQSSKRKDFTNKMQEKRITQNIEVPFWSTLKRQATSKACPKTELLKLDTKLRKVFEMVRIL